MTPGHKPKTFELGQIASADSNLVIINIVDLKGQVTSFHMNLENVNSFSMCTATHMQFDVTFYAADCTLDTLNDPEIPTIWIGELEYYQEGDNKWQHTN